MIVYEKLILWTVLLETLGLAGSWGPLAAHFKPMTGGFRYWARPDTIRLPPWPEKVPFTRGDRRGLGDVAIYLAIIAAAMTTLVAPTVTHTGVSLVNPTLVITVIGLLIVMGLRYKVVFLAARSEQYLPALLFFAVLGPVDLVVALKLLIVVVWIGAGVSKFGRHFSRWSHRWSATRRGRRERSSGSTTAASPTTCDHPTPPACSPTSAARPSRSCCPSCCCSRPTRPSPCSP